ncbi:NGG1p interacting factor 3 [Mycena latifolia]|nr:NGG1p interacting factor 3 [Mycena latifolia]
MASSLFMKAVSNDVQRIAPPVLAGSWDNVGQKLHNPRISGKRLQLTIDSTLHVCDEAIGVSTIVSYRTPIFASMKSLTLATPLQHTLLRCAAAGISVYSPHSALDGVFGGMNDWLASCMGADPQKATWLETKPATEAIGGDGTFDPPISMEVLECRIKKNLSLSQIQVGYSPLRPERLVSTVAICAGSGGSLFSVMGSTTADVWFTGEMEHHEVLAAVAAGSHIILFTCGHTNTKRGDLPLLQVAHRA